jgi:hypothetical protein
VTDDLQRLVDRAAIHDLLVAYSWAIDTWDTSGAVSCFAPDGRLLSGDGTVLAEGTEALFAYFGRGRVGGRFATMGDGELISISHILGSILVEGLTPDRANARSACTATSLARHPDREALYLHGIRYEDALRRTDAGWRIAERRHRLDWVRVVSESAAPRGGG